VLTPESLAASPIRYANLRPFLGRPVMVKHKKVIIKGVIEGVRTGNDGSAELIVSTEIGEILPVGFADVRLVGNAARIAKAHPKPPKPKPVPPPPPDRPFFGQSNVLE
jgi:hypothetical protein